METPATTLRQDGRVLGLVCGGHFMSHIYLIALPPLFPLLRAEFGVSYAELGLLITVFYGAAAVTQLPVGFLVDKVGGPLVVALGLGAEGAAFALMGFAQGYPTLLLLSVFAGLGHSVFHPADFAILSATIDENRIARAFSLHTFAGHLGTAVSPALVVFLAAFWDWRGALIAIGLGGLAAMAAVLAARVSLTGEIEARREARTEGADAGPGGDAGGGIAMFLSWPMVLMLVFFLSTALTSSGVRSFAVAALNEIHATPMAVAAAALTAYLSASAVGVLAGGLLADRTKRHDLIAIAAFAVTGAIMVLVALAPLSAALLATAFLVGGFLQGMVRPARDMMIRARASRRTLGKAYGYVSTGAAVGGAVAPVMFGWIVDFGQAAWVFYVIALFMAVSMLAVALDRRRRALA